MQAPANANLAPPGDYMLFLVDTNGVPSVGVVRPRSRPPATRRRRPRRRTSSRPARRARSRCRWTASTDNVGVARYNVHRVDDGRLHAERRRTGSRSRRARATPTRRSPPGTYYYKVTAEDVAGNVEPAVERGERDASRGQPGLVAAYGFDEGSGTTTADQSGNGNNGHALERDAGRRSAAGSATRSPSTARTPSSRSPTRTRST